MIVDARINVFLNCWDVENFDDKVNVIEKGLPQLQSLPLGWMEMSVCQTLVKAKQYPSSIEC